MIMMHCSCMASICVAKKGLLLTYQQQQQQGLIEHKLKFNSGLTTAFEVNKVSW